MIWLIVGGLLLVSFGGVLIFGAPYLPTLAPQVAVAIQLIDLRPGDRLLELGCGDGKVLIAAARQGITVTGYELNPFLALLAWLRTRRYKKHVRIIWGNFWRQPWPEADALFVFLLPRYMPKLDKKVMQYKHKPVILVSFAFEVPGKTPNAECSGLYLYQYK
jgi:SAM-dependent methyltransferase